MMRTQRHPPEETVPKPRRVDLLVALNIILGLKEQLKLRTRWRRGTQWLGARLRRGTQWFAAFGIKRGAEYIFARFHPAQPSVYWVRPKKAAFPLCVRRGTSDLDVLHQVFCEGEYSCLDDLTNVSLIIDCGANVGYSASYFLSQFPQSQVVAVEPDPGNFAMLQRNVAAYGERAQLVNAGIWSHPTRLSISSECYRDGRDWTKQVHPAKSSEEVSVNGIDVGSLLGSSGYRRLSILKMDIEGAEAVVFAGTPTWLDKVDSIAIELHNDSMFGNGPDVFFAAISQCGFEISTSGDLTICRR